MESATLAERLKQAAFAVGAVATLERIAVMRLDDATLGSLPFRLPRDEAEARDPAAAVFVAAAAFAAVSDAASAYASPPPSAPWDLELRAGDRSIPVFVRVARSGDGDHDDVNARLNDAVDADPKLWPRDTFVSVTFDPNEAARADAIDPQLLVDEFLALLRGDRFALFSGNERLPAEGFPTLARLGGWINTYPLPGRERGIVVINGAPPPANRDNAGPALAPTIAAARDAARSAQVSGAWLAILTSDQGEPGMGLPALRGRSFETEPFDYVSLTDGANAVSVNP